MFPQIRLHRGYTGAMEVILGYLGFGFRENSETPDLLESHRDCIRAMMVVCRGPRNSRSSDGFGEFWSGFSNFLGFLVW